MNHDIVNVFLLRALSEEYINLRQQGVNNDTKGMQRDVEKAFERVAEQVGVFYLPKEDE